MSEPGQEQVGQQPAKNAPPNSGAPHSSIPQHGWDIRGVLSWTVPFLKGKGVASARLDCELLLTSVLNCRRIDLYTQIDRPLSREEQQAFGSLLRRRVKGEPIAYILGQREFMGHLFQVNREVLIPRPETELLVEEALSFLKRSRDTGRSAEVVHGLDVGTGSGCIAISLALGWPELQMCAWDISQSALGVAAENARQLKVDSQLQFVQADALSSTAWQEATAYDVVVSNPPYIAPSERVMLEKDVAAYEPATALFAEEEGLIFYRVMAKQAKACLKPNGRAFWEIGYTQKDSVCELLVAEGWRDIVVRADYSGIDRIISASPPAVAQ